jgi:hypothetical protein
MIKKAVKLWAPLVIYRVYKPSASRRPYPNSTIETTTSIDNVGQRACFGERFSCITTRRCLQPFLGHWCYWLRCRACRRSTCHCGIQSSRVSPCGVREGEIAANVSISSTTRGGKAKTLTETVNRPGLEFVQVDDLIDNDLTEALGGMLSFFFSSVVFERLFQVSVL